MRKIAIALALTAVFTPISASADWAQVTTQAPVERLVSNLTARVTERPLDAQAHYTLARIHSMAYAFGTATVSVMESDEETGMPEFAPYQSVRLPHKEFDPTPERFAHFQASIAHYQIATELASDEPLYWLGLAWMLDDGSSFAPIVGAPDGGQPESTLDAEESLRVLSLLESLGTGGSKRNAAFDEARSRFILYLPEILAARDSESDVVRDEIARLLTVSWRDLAIDAYRRAYELSLAQDLDLDSIGMEGDSAVSFEAGKALVRLLRMQPESMGSSQRGILAEISRVEESVAQLDAKSKWITPIIFPIHSQLPLSQLVDDERIVRFDLDGDGERGLWPWVSPDTGILVWTKHAWKPIRSGRQLFGSVTWWTAWQNGYEALASLDDDGDGWLDGKELVGIAVWRDRNQNGISDRGEVIPARPFGIVRIATYPDVDAHEGVPANRLGLEMRDGSTLPTYDWTPKRIE